MLSARKPSQSFPISSSEPSSQWFTLSHNKSGLMQKSFDEQRKSLHVCSVKRKMFVYACKVNEIYLLFHFLTSVFDSCNNKLKAVVVAPRIRHILECDVVCSREECSESLFCISCNQNIMKNMETLISLNFLRQLMSALWFDECAPS